MKLFLISQTHNDKYDTYDSAVVAAEDAETAKAMDPSTGNPVTNWKESFNMWCDGPEHVTVKYLGDAVFGIDEGVICASFNAG